MGNLDETDIIILRILQKDAKKQLRKSQKT